MGAPKASNDTKEKAMSGQDKENQENVQEVSSLGHAVTFESDDVQSQAAAGDEGRIEVILQEQVNVFISQTETVIHPSIEQDDEDGQYVDYTEGEEGKEGGDEDDEDAEAEEVDVGEQQVAEEGEESAELLDMQGGYEEIDKEEEELEKGSLKQKWTCGGGRVKW